MPATVNVLGEVWGDIRFKVLARHLGENQYSAIGRMTALWGECTLQDSYILDIDIVAEYLDIDADRVEEVLCHRAKLAEMVPEGVRIRGTVGRVEWRARLRANGQAGGKAAALTAERDDNGRFVSAPTQHQAPTEPSSKPPPSTSQANTGPTATTTSDSTTTSRSLPGVSAGADAVPLWHRQAQELRARRQRVKKRQVDVATACMVKTTEVSAWENGKAEPGPGALQRYNDMLVTWEASAAEAKAPTSDHVQFVRWFTARYQKHHGCSPTWGSRAGGQVKTLLSQHPRAELERRADIMFTRCPTWPAENPSLGTLAAHFDAFGSTARPKRQNAIGTAATAAEHAAEAEAARNGKRF